MRYVSTRGGGRALRASEAIVRGLDENGGLFVPESVPRFSEEERLALTRCAYPEASARILSTLLTDFSPDALREMTSLAYGRFDTPEVAPLKAVREGVYALELFHGPTLAFKDIALTLLARLLAASGAQCGHEGKFLILTATSGDTGKAALSGFADAPGASCVVYYPKDGVSAVQKLQMATQCGSNVHVIAVEGNFDDTQSGVKAIFTDREAGKQLAARGFSFSSANSINWGRLAPQIVYYFTAYADLVRRGAIRYGEEVNFAVPTGNFGDILAGVYAGRMGLPVGRLICASNENRVLTDFLESGRYDIRRPFHLTSSPSMDILISSNLERLLFDACGRDAAKVCGWMRALKEEGVYEVDPETRSRLRAQLWGGSCDEAGTLSQIRETWREDRYLLDPHTAVGMRVANEYRRNTGDMRPCVVLATASPFKFGRAVAQALLPAGDQRAQDDFELCARVADLTGLAVPEAISELKRLPIRHTRVCGRGEMLAALLKEIENE